MAIEKSSLFLNPFSHQWLAKNATQKAPRMSENTSPPDTPGGVLRSNHNRTLSRTAETKDFACLASHPVQGWMGKNKAFCSPGTQNGHRVIKVYSLQPPT